MWSKELEVATRLAFEAGRVTMEVHDREFTVEQKKNRDPVTEADRRANELICGELRKLFPGDLVVGEVAPGVLLRAGEHEQRALHELVLGDVALDVPVAGDAHVEHRVGLPPPAAREDREADGSAGPPPSHGRQAPPASAPPQIRH